MYERLTRQTPTGYEADGLMAVERLGRLEDVIDRLTGEYRQTREGLHRLKSQGKIQSAMYTQLKENQKALEELLLRLGCK